MLKSKEWKENSNGKDTVTIQSDNSDLCNHISIPAFVKRTGKERNLTKIASIRESKEDLHSSYGSSPKFKSSVKIQKRPMFFRDGEWNTEMREKYNNYQQLFVSPKLSKVRVKPEDVNHDEPDAQAKQIQE